MALPRDDHGAPEIIRRQPAPRSPLGPNRAGWFLVGTEPDGVETIVQSRVSVASELAPLTARRILVGPREDTGPTGFVGWQEVMVPIGVPERDDTPARVYYPAPAEVVEIVSGRRISGGGGEGAPIANVAGGWPWLVLVHGVAPSVVGEGGARDPERDEAVLCEGRLEGSLDLFRRWESIQRSLARAGYVSIALDMSWRDEGLARPGAVRIAADWFSRRSDWAEVIDPDRLGLAGHSAGAVEVADSIVDLGAGATAVLGPRPEAVTLTGPNLSIGSLGDTNGSTRLMYLSAPAPRHLVLVNFYSHYAFFDGVCDQSLPEDAALQRAATALALRRFFDRYIGGRDIPPDLGIALSRPGSPGVSRVCFDLEIDGPGGDQC